MFRYKDYNYRFLSFIINMCNYIDHVNVNYIFILSLHTSIYFTDKMGC